MNNEKKNKRQRDDRSKSSDNSKGRRHESTITKHYALYSDRPPLSNLLSFKFSNFAGLIKMWDILLLWPIPKHYSGNDLKVLVVILAKCNEDVNG